MPFDRVWQLWKEHSTGGGRVRRVRKDEGRDHVVEILLPVDPTSWEDAFIAEVREIPILTERWIHLLTAWGEDVRCWTILFDPDVGAHVPRQGDAGSKLA